MALENYLTDLQGSKRHPRSGGKTIIWKSYTLMSRMLKELNQ